MQSDVYECGLGTANADCELMNEYSAAGEMQGDTKAALIDLLYRLADDDLVVGHRNSEWTGLGPILEADIAFSSIAQDQMGQAWVYYRMLQELGEPDADSNAFLREASQFRCASLVSLGRGDWAFSTVRLFLYETAKGLRAGALSRSSYKPLAAFARKLRGEQKYHLMHARMWMDKLGAATAESHGLMQTALDELYSHGLGLFEPTKWDAEIAERGIGPKESDLCGQWRMEVDQVMAGSGMRVPSEVDPAYGGRVGRHPDELAVLLEAMQKVVRLDPTASW